MGVLCDYVVYVCVSPLTACRDSSQPLFSRPSLDTMGPGDLNLSTIPATAALPLMLQGASPTYKSSGVSLCVCVSSPVECR